MRIYFSIIMIIFIIIIITFLSKKYKLNKKQLLIFWMLVLFWASISIIRAYRKSFVVTPIEFGGLSGSALMAAKITSAYGLISFLIRTPIFFLTDILNKRRIFIMLAMVFMILTSFFVIVKPSITTIYYSSLAMGVSASMLAIFNVMFSETFSKENAAVSASILSVAPLLAEFLAAPIQYLGTFGKVKHFSILFGFSLAFAIITFILSFFIEDMKNTKAFSKEKVKFVITNKKFIVACLISIVISFIKFSTSGTNMLFYAEKVLNMNPLMLAFLDPMFAGPQLIASILVGTYFKNKLGIEKTLLLSLFSLILFNIIIILTKNPYIAFFSYMLNGFGYGGTYISLISITLQYFEKEYRNISMGIFQGFFSAGIFFGDRIYVWLSSILKHNPKSIFMLVLFISFLSIVTVTLKLLSRGVNNEFR